MTKWLPVPGYKAYEVSDEGQVRRRGRILKALRAKTGHLSVTLSTYPTKKQAKVHQLVLLAFVGPPPEGMEARHYPDRNPANCRLDNLSWASRLTNVHDRKEHGTDNVGERHGMSKLTWDEVDLIRTLRGVLTQEEIARRFNVDPSTISLVMNRKNWRE